MSHTGTDMTTSPSNTAGLPSFMSTRLLGREQISDLPIPVVNPTLNVPRAKNPVEFMSWLSGSRVGQALETLTRACAALLPSWRTTYLHTIGIAPILNMTLSPQDTPNKAARWAEENSEAVWREWAPNTGSYMNEGNPMNFNFKERLLRLKL